MTVTLHAADDRQRLDDSARREPDAKQRDRYRAVLLAVDGGLEGDEIARRLGRSPRFVDKWLARYRRGGRAALVPGRQPGRPPGRPPKLAPGQEEQLRARLDAGPRDGDGVCTLRGKDVCRIIEREFGVVHTIGGIYDVLRRLGYSSLVPRPRHRKNDPAAASAFAEAGAPLLPARRPRTTPASGSAGSCRTRPGWASRGR
jgi:transposase